MFFTLDDKFIFTEMVWLRRNFIEFTDNRFAYNPDPVTNWNYAHEMFHPGPAAAHLKSKRREVMKPGFCILEDIADPQRKWPF